MQFLPVHGENPWQRIGSHRALERKEAQEEKVKNRPGAGTPKRLNDHPYWNTDDLYTENHRTRHYRGILRFYDSRLAPERQGLNGE